MNAFKRWLKPVIEDNTCPRGKTFDYFIQILIIISLVSMAMETMPGYSPIYYTILQSIEAVCVIIFSIEYLLRIYAADKPFKYIFSFYGVVDLMAILPFYLTSFLDIRAVRVFRIFRVFRALKLVRYNRAMRRFHRAFQMIREELILFFMIALMVIFLAATGIYYFESEAQPEHFGSIPSSVWWSVVTLTTVGYGDAYPITAGGKMFTFFVLATGLGIVAVPAGLVATSLSKAREIEKEERKERESLEDRIS
ncbi:MAG: ion transporter [Flavobacteriales bacterium]|nr:ion transporter [Flavobacteriales bacterium]